MFTERPHQGTEATPPSSRLPVWGEGGGLHRKQVRSLRLPTGLSAKHTKDFLSSSPFPTMVVGHYSAMPFQSYKLSQGGSETSFISSAESVPWRNWRAGSGGGEGETLETPVSHQFFLLFFFLLIIYLFGCDGS